MNGPGATERDTLNGMMTKKADYQGARRLLPTPEQEAELLRRVTTAAPNGPILRVYEA